MHSIEKSSESLYLAISKKKLITPKLHSFVV